MDLGAHALGFNFYPPSPRSISPAAAWEIARKLPPVVATIGVFVNWPAHVVAALAGALRLDGVQLHGDEQPGEVRDLARRFRVIKAFAAGPRFKLATLARYKPASAFLLDGYDSGLYGGTGQTADWRLAREARVRARGGVGVLEFLERRDERLRDVAAPVRAEAAAHVRPGLHRGGHNVFRRILSRIPRRECLPRETSGPPTKPVGTT